MDKKQLKQRYIEIAVGFFVVLAIAALAVMSFKVATWGGTGGASTYSLFAQFDNIGGLKERAPVKIGGVVVGRIASITLDQQNFVPVVELKISSEFSGLADTTSASILTSGLLGEQYVGLSPGFMLDGEDIGILKNGDEIFDTKPAMVLEEMIGQFLYNQGEK